MIEKIRNEEIRATLGRFGKRKSENDRSRTEMVRSRGEKD